MLNCSSKLCVPPMESIISESQRLNIIHYVMARKQKSKFDLWCSYYKDGASCIDLSSGLGRVVCLIYESAGFLLYSHCQ